MRGPKVAAIAAIVGSLLVGGVVATQAAPEKHISLANRTYDGWIRMSVWVSTQRLGEWCIRPDTTEEHVVPGYADRVTIRVERRGCTGTPTGWWNYYSASSRIHAPEVSVFSAVVDGSFPYPQLLDVSPGWMK